MPNQRKTKRPRKRSRVSGALRRKLLLDAASAVFVEIGYEQARVTDISSRANTSNATFYVYFRSKADAARALAEEVVADLTKDASEEDMPDTLEALIDFLITVCADSYKKYGDLIPELLVGVASGHPDFPNDVYKPIKLLLRKNFNHLIKLKKFSSRAPLNSLVDFLADDLYSKIHLLPNSDKRTFIKQWYLNALSNI